MGYYLCRSPCPLCSQHRKIQNTEDIQTDWFCGDCLRQKTEDSQWVKALAVKSKGTVKGKHWLPQIVLWPSHVCSNTCVSMCVCTHINKINLIKKFFKTEDAWLPSRSQIHHLFCSPVTTTVSFVRVSTCCERLSLGPFSQFCGPSKEVRPLSLVSLLRSCLLAMMFKISAVSAHKEVRARTLAHRSQLVCVGTISQSRAAGNFAYRPTEWSGGKSRSQIIDSGWKLMEKQGWRFL